MSIIAIGTVKHDLVAVRATGQKWMIARIITRNTCTSIIGNIWIIIRRTNVGTIILVVKRCLTRTYIDT